MRRGRHREYWLGARAGSGEGSRGVLRVERRSDDAYEGHGYRSCGGKNSRELYLPVDCGNGIGEGRIQRNGAGTGAAEGADCNDSIGAHWKSRGRGGDGGFSGVGGIVVGYRGGDSVGWRADSVLMERLDKMTKKMSRKEKQVPELVRPRMQTSHPI